MSNLQNRSSFQAVKGQDALLAYQPIEYQPNTYVERNGLIFKSLSATSTTFISQEWELIADLREVRVPNIASRNALTGMTATTGTTGIRIPILDNTNVLVLDAFSDPQVAVHEFARYNYNQSTGTWLLLQKGTGTTTTNVSNYQLLTNKPPVISGVTVNVGNGLVGGGSVFGTNISPFSAGGVITVSHQDTSAQPSLNGSGYAYVQKLNLDTFGHVTGATLSTWIHPTGLTQNFNNTGYTYIQSIQVNNGHITGLGTSTWVHPATSFQGSSNNTGNVFIQSIQLDSNGHVTGISTGTASGGGGGGSPLRYNGDFGGALTMSSGGTLTISGGTNIKTTRTGGAINAGLRVDFVSGVVANQVLYSNGSNGVVGSPNFVFSAGTSTLRTSNLVLTNSFTLNTITTGSTSDQILTRNVSTGLIKELSYGTLIRGIAGAPINSVQYNNGNGFGGNNKWLFDPVNFGLTFGVRSGSTGANSVTIATVGRADAANSFAGGSVFSANTVTVYPIVAAGVGSFNFSTTTGAGAGTGTFAPWSTILGGQDHLIKSNNNYSVIIGGQTNKIGNISTNSYIFGGVQNNVSGGTIQHQNSGIFGGNQNLIAVNSLSSNLYILGGSTNKITGGTGSIIIGGSSNNLGVSSSIILGGNTNKLVGTSQNATIIGGTNNVITGSSNNSGIFSSSSKIFSSQLSHIFGGNNNTIRGTAGQNVIVGGSSTTLTGNTTINSGALAATSSNMYISGNAVLLGGLSNTMIKMSLSSLIGGQSNVLTGSTASDSSIIHATNTTLFNTSHSVIIGGTFQSMNFTGNANHNVILGGTQNKITGTTQNTSAVISTQNSKIFASPLSIILGGNTHTINNTSSGQNAIIGGQSHTMSGSSFNSGIVMGATSSVHNSQYSAVVAGQSNQIKLANQGVILGGSQNTLNPSSAGGLSAIIGGNQQQIKTSSGGGNALISGNLNIINGFANNSVIIGGNQNTLNNGSNMSAIFSGFLNLIDGGGNGVQTSVLIGGTTNSLLAGHQCAAIVGGFSNTISGNTVSNSAQANSIFGGNTNTIKTHNQQNTIMGGGFNTISGTSNTSTIIGSSGSKIIGASNSVILGGSNISLTGNSQSNFVVVPGIMIWNTPSTGVVTDDVLLLNNITKKVNKISQANLVPVGNGITKSSGGVIILGGSLTGNTTIAGGGTLTLNNGSWTFGSRIAGTVGANSFTVGDNNAASGFSGSFVFGTNCLASGNYALATGQFTKATNAGCVSMGSVTKASGQVSFAGGWMITGDLTKPVTAGGSGAFIWSVNSAAQVAGRGANAFGSAILGGQDHNIDSSNTFAAIIGGSGINVPAGGSYNSFVNVPNLAIWSTPPSSVGTDLVLAWNSTDKKVKLGTLSSTSDERLKTNIVPLTGILDKIQKLNTYEYTNNEIIKPMEGIKNYGLTAQEVEQVFPHVVKDNYVWEETTYKTVDYRHLVPVLFAAIKELNDKIKTLESKLND